MTDHKSKLDEIKVRHVYKEGVRGTKNDEDNEEQTHADRAALLEIVAGLRPLESIALRMARARRMRLDAKRKLNGAPRPGEPPMTDTRKAQCLAELSTARTEWRKATTALWRLAAKMDAGEA